MSESIKQRPVYRNIHIGQLLTYRLPVAGIVSILHRVSGALMFVLLPFIIWMFDASVSSEVSYAGFTGAFSAGVGFVPGWFLKLVALALIWAFLHHLIAGLRHLWMDIAHAVDLKFGRQSALVTLGVSLLLTLACAYKLFY
jgi:succinate dehydrogenase / fumarate reductase, cytochrome b subunit